MLPKYEELFFLKGIYQMQCQRTKEQSESQIFQSRLVFQDVLLKLLENLKETGNGEEESWCSS